jgi:hypothetical protein
MSARGLEVGRRYPGQSEVWHCAMQNRVRMHNPADLDRRDAYADWDDPLVSDEPSIRWKLRANVQGEDPESPSMRALQTEVGESPRVRRLLDRHLGAKAGHATPAYAKWQGAHWVLHALADLGYPPGDPALEPLRDHVIETWLDPIFYFDFEADAKADAYRVRGVPVMNGRHRRCASQQGNALLAVIRLGLVDDRAPRLVERLLHWQWPDGGWNCDKDPTADTSSFMETLPPMRALAAWAALTGDVEAERAAQRATEVFLERRLFKRRSDGRVIHPEFTKLHYPLYWHYDLLAGLKAIAELGRIGDPRCADAVDLLESKWLPDRGWPAEAKYYTHSTTVALGNDDVDWGGTSGRRSNPWVTVDALAVLGVSGRLAAWPTGRNAGKDLVPEPS